MACDTPYMVKDENKEYIPVPCGKCPPCLKRRASAWSFRLMQEEKRSITAHFITLTYDTQHVPITSRGMLTLQKTAVQLFMKRLRKLNPNKLKYYAVGEYGSHTMRPHYHIILFNAEIETIQKAWPYGQVHYGTVTGASIGYCLTYTQKPRVIPLHERDDRQKEFNLQSTRLGDNYLTPAVRRWHISDLLERVYLPLDQGKKAAMPRYYKDKLYNFNQRSRIAQWGYHRSLQLEALQSRKNAQLYVNRKESDDKIRTDAIRQRFQLMYYRAKQRQAAC